MFCHERFLDHTLSEILSGDKCKCIDFRNITNFKID